MRIRSGAFCDGRGSQEAFWCVRSCWGWEGCAAVLIRAEVVPVDHFMREPQKAWGPEGPEQLQKAEAQGVRVRVRVCAHVCACDDDQGHHSAPLHGHHLLCLLWSSRRHSSHQAV